MLRSKRFMLSAIFVATLAACGGGSSSVTTTTPPPSGGGNTPKLTVTGNVMVGPLEGGSVDVYVVSPTGAASRLTSASVKTDASGKFTVDVDMPAAGSFLKVVASGGSYVSEADIAGAKVTAGTFASLMPFASGSSLTMHVTPLTDFVARRTEAALSGSTLAAALDGATKVVSGWTGVSVDSSLLPTFDGTGADNAKLYGLVLGALEQLWMNLGKSAVDVYGALGCDVADGKLDGKGADGKACAIGTGAGLDTLGTTELIRAINAYAVSTKTIHKSKGVDVTPLASTARTAVLKVAPASSGASVGSTGAISFMRMAGSGKEVVLVAAREQGLVMVDMSNPAAPVINTLNALNALTKPLMASVGGVIPIPGAVSTQAMLYSYTSKKVITVDLDTNTIIKSADLPLTKTASFSGASGVYVAGGIPDPSTGLVWLATSEGYKGVNPATLAVESSAAMPSDTPENMGGDPGRRMLFAPHYGGYAGGLDWIDLSTPTPTTYALASGEWNNLVKSAFSIADSGTVDNGYNVGIIIGEDVQKAVVMSLDKTQYTFDSTTKTFKPNAGAKVTAVTDFTGMTLAGSAIDSVTHMALMMAGYSNSVVVAKLDNPLAPKTGTWTGFEGWKGYNLSYSDYSYATDPHAVGAFNVQGKSYGFLLNNVTSGGTNKVLVVDMQAFYDAAAGTSNQLTTNPMGASIKPVTWTAR